MQLDGGECCPCGECEPGVSYPCSFGEASSSVSFGDRIGASAAEGIVGAAVGAGGAIAVSGGLSTASGTAGTSSESISAETMKSQSNTVDFDSIPQSSPEIDPLRMSPEEFETHKKKYWDKIRKEYVPAEAPSNFPLLSEERITFRFLENNPGYPKEAHEVFNKILKEKQENIKFDVKAEQVRIKRGVSLKEEFLEIWNSRPKAFNEYFTSNNMERLLELLKNNVKDGGTFYSTFPELEQKLSRSNNPEEREWIKKFQSIIRRNWRFEPPRSGSGKNKILGSADSKSYAAVIGSRA